jgi:hypothetical protein
VFFLRAFPEYKAYETPKYFKSDWLNEYWDQCNDSSDDYRFVYIGPKGSWYVYILALGFTSHKNYRVGGSTITTITPSNFSNKSSGLFSVFAMETKINSTLQILQNVP